MHFPTRTARPYRPLRGLLPARAGTRFSLLSGLLLVLAAIAAASPSLAEEFDLASLTENIDLPLQPAN